MRYVSGLLFAVVALVVGCSAAPETFTPPIPTPEDAAVFATATLLPQVSTDTLSPGGEITSTPNPPDSLTAEELHHRLDPFLGADPACMLPCYNGLVAGQASLPDVLDFYARLGIGAADLIPGDYEAAQDGTGRLGAWLNKATDEVQAEQAGLTPPLVDTYLEDNVLQYVYIGWRYNPPYLTPARVLEALGQPEQVDVGLVPDATPPTYILRLLYPAQQAGFAFYGAVTEVGGQQQVCFSGEAVQRTFLGIFAPGVPMMEGLSDNETLQPLMDSLGVPYQAFAAQASTGGCLPVPASQ